MGWGELVLHICSQRNGICKVWVMFGMCIFISVQGDSDASCQMEDRVRLTRLVNTCCAIFPSTKTSCLYFLKTFSETLHWHISRDSVDLLPTPIPFHNTSAGTAAHPVLYFTWLPLLFHDPVDVGNLISGSSAFSKTSLNIRKFTVHIVLKPGLENFEHSGKEPACQCRRHNRCGFDPGVGKIPWRRAWQPTPEFLPGESHRQRTSP